MEMINGTGTTLYGHREPWADGSYIATKWVVFVFLPVLPLGSYRVLKGETEGRFMGWNTGYHLVPVPLQWRQIIRTLAFTLFLGPFITFIFVTVLSFVGYTYLVNFLG